MDGTASAPTLSVGDRVWYWSRRSGEPAVKRIATITQLSDDGLFARVRWFGTHTVPVQTVDVTRLHRIEQEDSQ